MKDKIKNIIKRMKDENGLVIVEATIVFPVMFFVLLFIIFIGNMYYEQARVDNIVLSYAVKGAEYCADPYQYDIENGDGIPTEVKDVKTEPYRYILGGAFEGSISKIEDKISAEVKEEINEGRLIFFSNSKANVVGTDNDKIGTFKSYIVYSSFVVQVNYEIKFPIRFIGKNDATIAKLSSRAQVSVSDAPEFINNVDMAVDLLDGNSTVETIKGIFDKVNDFISNFGK